MPSGLLFAWLLSNCGGRHAVWKQMHRMRDKNHALIVHNWSNNNKKDTQIKMMTKRRTKGGKIMWTNVSVISLDFKKVWPSTMMSIRPFRSTVQHILSIIKSSFTQLKHELPILSDQQLKKKCCCLTDIRQCSLWGSTITAPFISIDLLLHLMFKNWNFSKCWQRPIGTGIMLSYECVHYHFQGCQ